MKDLHKTVVLLYNILGDEKHENAKEIAVFSAEISDNKTKNGESLQVFDDDTTARVALLEGKVYTPTKRLYAQELSITKLPTALISYRH